MQDAIRVKTSYKTVIDGLLHKSARLPSEDYQRHGIFISVHLAVGLLALASLPFFLLIADESGGRAASALSLLPIWMMSPLLSVAYLSKTGRLSRAFLLTAALTAAFVVWVASLTGGMQSPHLIWLGVIPLEVALSGNRSIVKQALLICFAAIGALWVWQVSGFMSSMAVGNEEDTLIGTVSVTVAIIYAGLLAIRIEGLHRGRLNSVAEKEMYYRSLANTVSDMITRHDLNGDVTFASSAARFLIDAQPHTLMANGLFHQIHIQDRPAYLHALSQCMKGTERDRQPTAVELRIMTTAQDEQEMSEPPRQGSIRWVEMKCAPEYDEAGAVCGAITITRDISKRKQQQAAAEEARKEAEQANDSKTRFLANVTHELRTPLNTIIGFSEILSHPELTHGHEERICEYAELIHKGGNHLLQLVNALLDMSRIESGNFEINPQSFDLCDLAQSCCKMMQTEADRRNIALYSHCEKDVFDIYADPRACRQILLNLISNALKFSDEGDKVSVSVGWSRDDEGQISRDKILLAVRDTGIGIDKKDIPKLGMPFVQAESSLQRRYEGAGIGLSIVRGLAELQGGSMEINSKLGQGTTVMVNLPMDMALETDGQDTRSANSVITLDKAQKDKRLGGNKKNKVA